MNSLYNHYIIDMSSNNNFVQVPTMQGDGNGVRGIEIELIANGTQYIVDAENTIVSIMGSKPDTKHILNECTVSDEGYILVDITSQMSAVKGRGDYSIVFMDKNTNSQLKSFPFHILTTSAPFNISEIISSDEFQLLTKRITQVEGIVIEGNEIIDDLTEFGATAKANETIRVNAENQRIINENERSELFDTMMKSANEQIERLENTNDTATASAELAKQYSESAKSSADDASTSAEKANISEINAEDYMKNAESYMNTAIEKAANADESESIATEKANEASSSAANASLSEKNALESANTSTDMADLAKSYAVGTDGVVRPDDLTDNAKYYYELAKAHALASSGIIFMGTITFAELSLEINQETNYMFNISDEFVTDDTFNIGAGVRYSAGTNVCRTGDGYWDVFCGLESFGKNEIVTSSINDEPLDQKEGEYWIFSY